MTHAETVAADLARACGIQFSQIPTGDVGQQIIRYTRILAGQGYFDYANEEGEKSMNGTTERVWRFAADYVRERERPPTMKEIKDGCGIASTSTVSYHLDKLTKLGVISQRERGVSRAWRVLQQPGRRAS